MSRFFCTLILLVILAPATLLAGAKKTPPLSIRLHGEGSRSDGASFVSELTLTNPPKKIFIKKVPVVNETDIKAFYPFPGNDGLAGAYFRLDAHGANKLQQFSIEDKGRLSVVLINGRPAATLQISNVRDNILYVPGGLLPEDIAVLRMKYPVIGSESEFGKKKPTFKNQPAP
jgi:hypothetical protein